MKRRILSALMAFMIALTTVIGGMPGIEAYANTVEKKEKFIVKHMDNERLREKFFPDLVVEESPATTDEAIEVETEVVTDSTIGTETTTNEAIDTSVDTLPDLTYKEVTEDIVAVEGTGTEIQELLEDPDIIAAEYDSPVSIRGDIMPQSLVLIGEDQINDTAYAGTGIKVAIIDTGIDTDNTDINLSGGISFIEGTDYDDDNGHGTALAGIIGARADGQGIVGIAPEAQIYAVKALDSQGNGYYSNVIKGLEWCIENRMDIVVMSFGSDQYSGILHETIQEAHLQDILLIGAAGNQDSTVEYPAAYEEVMAAGSSNDDGIKTYNYTDAENIDIYAPGTGIQTYDNSQTLVTYSGSSMSAAHVAGVAAELWSYDMVKTNDMIREKIIQSSNKDQVITYPVLDGYETYLDRDVIVVPGDNTGEIGETTTDEAISILALLDPKDEF